MRQTILNILLFLVSFQLMGQEEVPEQKQKDLPVRDPFASGLLIDNQTTLIPVEKTFELVIQHKFGEIDNGFKDLFGLYAFGSNIRLGLNYVVIKNLQVGYGISRMRMYNDFSIKYTLLEQTRKNRIPVAIGLYANMAVDGREGTEFGKNYRFTNRFSYFSQFIMSRKFGDWVSIQLNASFTHFNATEPGIDHDKIAVGINGKVGVTYRSSIIFQYDVPLQVKEITEHNQFLNPAQHNLGIGYEIRTSAHAFHLYLSSTNGMIPQYNSVYNQNQWMKGQLMFGFSITRLYNFF